MIIKAFVLFSFIILVSCSSRPTNKPVSVVAPSKQDFAKAKPLPYKESTDFYAFSTDPESDVLSSETSQKWQGEHYKLQQPKQDDLLSFSLACHKGQHKEALASVPKLYNRYQKFPSFWTQVGICHFSSQNERKALLFFNKALELKNDYVPALNNLGVIYARRGEYQKAQVAFQKAHQASRFSKTPRFNLAQLYLRFGLAEDALKLLQGLTQDGSRDSSVIFAQAMALYFLNQYDQAEGFFQKLGTQNLKRPEMGLNFVLTLLKLKKDTLAKQVYNNINKPKDDNLLGYYEHVGSML